MRPLGQCASACDSVRRPPHGGPAGTLRLLPLPLVQARHEHFHRLRTVLPTRSAAQRIASHARGLAGAHRDTAARGQAGRASSRLSAPSTSGSLLLLELNADVAAVSPVPVQMWEPLAQSR